MSAATVAFAADLKRFGDDLAVVTPEGSHITYRDLAARVDRLGATFGSVRRLVQVEASNDLGALVAYLAALAHGHPVLLVSGNDAVHNEQFVAQYDPDVVCAAAGDETIVVERRPGTAHHLHPELCLLLSTSGSTGSPKLVRLSHDNVATNADAIADSLDIRPGDRALTTLPMSYCYGLSVVNSHLTRGAALMLSNASVVDDGFWARFAELRATTFAGVPYTFELLDRIGFAALDLPHLRTITQAGGRLAPETVQRYAQLAARRGWNFFVMYGQTEATARMAYVPPARLLDNPGAVGVPIPGGSFELAPVADAPPGAGELLYRGPNVMLGYATESADLARGRTVDVLRTGDIARRNEAGLYEIIGRSQRFVKPFGLRIDLDQLERTFARDGIDAVCAGDDHVLAVAVPGATDTGPVAALVRDHTGLPEHCIVTVELETVARLGNGKVDYRALVDRARAPHDHASTFQPHDAGAVYAAVLRLESVSPDDTFVSLRGDSLSYVEASIGLEEMLGYVPTGWQDIPVSALNALEPKRRRWRGMETGVLVRALAIFAVVAHHSRLQPYSGGAHALLAIAGFNFARFTLGPSGWNIGRNVRGIGRLVIPTAAALAVTMTFVEYQGLGKRLLLSNYLDPEAWRYWFIEVLVHVLILLTLLFCIPAVRRRERAAPFAFPLVLFAVVAGVSYASRATFVLPRDYEYRTHLTAFVFVLGWLVYRASTPAQKYLVSGLAALTLLPFFDRPAQSAIVFTAVLVLLWVRSVRVPPVAARIAGVVASASLYIYLVHFEVYRRLGDGVPRVVVTALALSSGIVVWFVIRAVSARFGTVPALARRWSAGRYEELAGNRVGHDVFARRRLHTNAVVVAAEHGRVGAGNETRVRDHL